MQKDRLDDLGKPICLLHQVCVGLSLPMSIKPTSVPSVRVELNAMLSCQDFA